ncbi:uncharacterized protein LOC121282477 [Carcharodon carcharias]|uniref:uncharacterized protein LOC121282477 n=1 Tax=Carcharodon carcharias TaxID=13397 RepID=UPI001B7E2657|nr:uncharacterized protein LOC121282477 [Carcharodon carcharias]
MYSGDKIKTPSKEVAHQFASAEWSSSEKTATVGYTTAYVDEEYTHTYMLPKERSFTHVKDDCDFALIQNDSLPAQVLSPKPENVPRRYLKVVKHRPSVICFSKKCLFFLNNNGIDEELYVVKAHTNLTAEIFQLKQKDLSNMHIKDHPTTAREILDGNVSEVLGQQDILGNGITRSQNYLASFNNQGEDNKDSNTSCLVFRSLSSCLQGAFSQHSPTPALTSAPTLFLPPPWQR